jgi:hypothetical protein
MKPDKNTNTNTIESPKTTQSHAINMMHWNDDVHDVINRQTGTQEIDLL